MLLVNFTATTPRKKVTNSWNRRQWCNLVVNNLADTVRFLNFHYRSEESRRTSVLNVMFWCQWLRVKEQGLLHRPSHRQELDVEDREIPIPSPTVASIDHNAMQPQDTFCLSRCDNKHNPSVHKLADHMHHIRYMVVGDFSELRGVEGPKTLYSVYTVFYTETHISHIDFCENRCLNSFLIKKAHSNINPSPFCFGAELLNLNCSMLRRSLML